MQGDILDSFLHQPPEDEATIRYLASLFHDPQVTAGYTAALILAKRGTASLTEICKAAVSPSAVLRRRAVVAYQEMEPFPEAESTMLECTGPVSRARERPSFKLAMHISD